MSPQHSTYRYGLSICTATARANRFHLIEWVEYHLLAGVDHIFLYDTSTSKSSRGSLADMLAAHVAEGSVTVVPWHYQNCVRHMASGRGTWWVESNTSGHIHFQPPRAIAQTAALASCYTRYRRVSRYGADVYT
jgi:hypothetical protein